MSSPKDLFDESRLSIQQKELYMNPEDEILFNSPNHEKINPNQSYVDKQISVNDLEANLLSESSNQKSSQKKRNVFTKRRMTDHLDSSYKILAKKKNSVSSESEEAYFITESQKNSLITSKELLNTINAFEANDKGGFLSRTNHQYSTNRSIHKPILATKKSNKLITCPKKKFIPSFKIPQSVLSKRVLK